MTGSNPNYTGSASEILNVDYASGWDVQSKKTINDSTGATLNIELDSTIRTVWLQADVSYYISFKTVATDINASTDIVLPGNSLWGWLHEFKVPRGIVGNNKKASVYLNILGYGIAGSLRIVKG